MKLVATLIILLILVLFVLLTVSLSFRVMVVRLAFLRKIISNPTLFAQKKPLVNKVTDLTYPSKWSRNKLDIYTSTQQPHVNKTLVWVHGGGFLAGDKKEIEEFATYLVVETGCTVIAINYERGPKGKYPTQLLQLVEVISYLQTHLDQFPQISLDHLFFGGDSAGAQIAAQFVLTQVSETYRQQVGIPSLLANEAILGTIFYCGPFDLANILKNQKHTPLPVKFLIRTIGWALTGKRQFATDPCLQVASITPLLTKDFPSTFVTDGNTASFEEDGLAFVAKLEALHVPVKSLFFNTSPARVLHEYQFDYTTEQAMHCLRETIEFIRQSGET